MYNTPVRLCRFSSFSALKSSYVHEIQKNQKKEKPIAHLTPSPPFPPPSPPSGTHTIKSEYRHSLLPLRSPSAPARARDLPIWPPDQRLSNLAAGSPACEHSRGLVPGAAGAGDRAPGPSPQPTLAPVSVGRKRSCKRQGGGPVRSTTATTLRRVCPAAPRTRVPSP